jgi:hypothetical protein
MSANFWLPLDNAVKWAFGLGIWKWPLETTLCGEGYPSPTENFTSKLNSITLIIFFLFLFPQANGHACVDFGCTNQLMGCFEVYPSTCWVSSQI